MSPLVTYLLVAALALFALLIIIEFVLSRALGPFLLQAGALIGVVAILHFSTGFPQPRQQFGGASLLLLVAGMFVCVLLGMAARYAFYLRGRFSWRSLLKPFAVSPIVLLPLLGSAQTAGELQAVQVVSFGILAFQNGFFWQLIFEHARSKI